MVAKDGVQFGAHPFSRRTFALKALLPYIRGEDERLSRSARLFLQLSYPALIPAAERASFGSKDEVPEIWEPRLNSVGISEVTIMGWGANLSGM
jgi:hypothetical protein